MKATWILLLACVFAAPAFGHPPVGIVMDRSGAVYYSDLEQVWRIAPDGTKRVVVPHVHTHELFLDADGALYGEHLWYEGEKTNVWGYRVWKLAPDGTLVDVVPAQKGFRTDYSFVRDAAGTMYWFDRGEITRVNKRPSGGVSSTLAECPDCRDPRWMTVTPDGWVYFVDGSDVHEVKPDGTTRILAKGLKEHVWTLPQVHDPHILFGLWTDPRKNVYVAIYGARKVKRISPEGAVEVVASTKFPWSPTGGFIAPNGDLWLLETSTLNKVRVRRIGKDKRSRVF